MEKGVYAVDEEWKESSTAIALNTDQNILRHLVAFT